MRYLKWIVIVFIVLCGLLVIESGLFENPPQPAKPPVLLQQTTAVEEQGATNVPVPENETVSNNSELEATDIVEFDADQAPEEVVILGAVDPKTEDPETGFKLQLELSSKGAAIRKATFSNGRDKGFDNRDPNNPQPLEIITPIQDRDGREILAMANGEFVLVDHKQQLPLQMLHWQSFGVETEPNDAQSARFEAVIKVKETDEPVIKITKTYTIRPNSYLLDCDITVENLTDSEQKVRFNLAGPSGLAREGFRADMRKLVSGFKRTSQDSKDEFYSSKLDINKFDGKRTFEEKQLEETGYSFLWSAVTNKYFAAILVPQQSEEEIWLPVSLKDEAGRNIPARTGRFYNPDGRKKTEDENIGLYFKIAPGTLAPNGQTGSTKQYGFNLYIGPKDKSLFDKNPEFRVLGFVNTITFMPCPCCPFMGLIRTLAFVILAVMKWMYAFIPNYGVVIIILVFLMRLLIHPLTKKSQVSMSKMSKLGPKTEEIKKKYANNKAEMNKQIMALYREQGASPIMGFLPMLIQMPIWIALWSAVYASIDLRGAAFLPFWITDLSMPDALFRFPAVTLPLFGKLDSFNLLPILMGVAFYLQQKLMPTQANASMNPQMAQQQKIMKIMLPLMFPLILYKGPSGVNLYIMSSTFAGVIEQHVIRKHIREREEAESKGLVAVTKKTGGKVKKKKPKPFFKT